MRVSNSSSIKKGNSFSKLFRNSTNPSNIFLGLSFFVYIGGVLLSRTREMVRGKEEGKRKNLCEFFSL